MAKLPASFDWQKSPAHIDLLGKFTKPRDIAQVMNWQYLQDTIKESPKEAIERFIQGDALVVCSLDEVMDCAFTAAELKKMAGEQGLKQTGTKAVLIERLLDSARTKMEKLTSRFRIMKCSPQALALVKEFEQRKQQALDAAKQKSFEALLKGEAREAYKSFLAYQREYIDPGFESQPYEIEELNFILSSSPKVLGKISQTHLANLRAASCMPVLWYGEPPESWLPDNFKTHLANNRTAINYLKCNAEMRADLARCGEYAQKVKLTFDENDVDSCELCLKLKDRIFDLSEFPELPFENCTSETGCKCRVENALDEDEQNGIVFRVMMSDDDWAEDEIDNEMEDEVDDKTDDAFIKLSQLKKMLDNGLITNEEYQKKKLEILSRM